MRSRNTFLGTNPALPIFIGRDADHRAHKINSYFETATFSNCEIRDEVTIHGGFDNDDKHNSERKKIIIESGKFHNTFIISTLSNCSVHLEEGGFKEVIIKDICNKDELPRSLTINTSNVKGIIKIVNCSFHQIDIYGTESSSTFISFENVRVTNLQIHYYYSHNGLNFVNLTSTNNNDSLVSFKSSNLGKSTFIRFHFDQFSCFEIISSIFSSSKILSSSNLESFQQKIITYSLNEEKKLINNAEVCKYALENREEDNDIEKEEAEKSYHNADQALQKHYDLKKVDFQKKDIFNEFKLAFKNSGDGENERIAYKYEMLWYKAYLNHERKSILLPPNDLAQKYRTLTLKKINIWFNEAILCVSYHYGHFGNNLGKAISTGVIVNSILFIILLCLQWYAPSPCNIDTNSAIEMVNTFFKKLLNPLEKMDVDNPYMIFDLFFKFNSGLFFYNIIRASRKFYH